MQWFWLPLTPIIKPWDPEDMRVTIRQALEWGQLQAAQGQLAAEIAEVNRELAERNRELERAQATIIEQEKLAVVGRFAREVVHEINNYLLIMASIPDELREHRRRELELIAEAEEITAMLRSLARDVADYAVGAESNTALGFADPAALAEAVVQTCRRHPAFKEVEIQLEAAATPPWTLDARQVKQMLLNLMKNAASATGHGGQVRLRVWADDSHLHLEVGDNGPGVPARHRARIFEPFFTTGGKDSMGLGLTICRRLVDNHGGDIEVSDLPGGGTAVRIRLPR